MTMQQDLRRDALMLVLDWYRATGIDATTSDEPIDWLQRGENAPGSDFAWPRPVGTPPAASPAQPPPALRTPPAPAASTAIRTTPAASALRPVPTTDGAAARTGASRASSLGELEALLKTFDGCALKATAKNLCFYRGAQKARVLLIGEAPGRDEDIEGRPFVGRAGQLLDKMLGSIGLGDESVHITNIVYWRPPGNRTPTPQEAEACRPFLERQVELVAPDVIVLLGGAAAKAVLNEAEGIMRLRGRWREVLIGSHRARVMATLHPAYLLRTPAAKRQVWRDLLAIKAALAS